MEWLKGKRTFIAAAAGFLAVVSQFADGKLDFQAAVAAVLPFVAVVFARIGAKQDDEKK